MTTTQLQDDTNHDEKPSLNEANENITQATKPEYMPDKFWDVQANMPRLEAMAKSYKSLEKKLSQADKQAIPDEYDIVLTQASPFKERQDQLEEKLRASNFSNQQAQLVYDIAAEWLAPKLAEISQQQQEQNIELDRLKLEQTFGGSTGWEKVRVKLHAWAKTRLPEDIIENIGSSYDGVMSLYNLMHETPKEPSFVHGVGEMNSDNEESLKHIMRQPQYWRDRDPSLLKRVTEGFKRLYPET